LTTGFIDRPLSPRDRAVREAVLDGEANNVATTNEAGRNNQTQTTAQWHADIGSAQAMSGNRTE